MKILYILLGAPTACPSCGNTVVPQVTLGAVYPITEYEATFSDFEQLVGGGDSKSAVGELLARWFAYQIRGSGKAVEVCARDGEVVDLPELHCRIQEDSAKQREFYAVAMARWR